MAGVVRRLLKSVLGARLSGIVAGTYTYFQGRENGKLTTSVARWAKVSCDVGGFDSSRTNVYSLQIFFYVQYKISMDVMYNSFLV